MSEPIRVLIVDDHEDARQYLHRLITFEEGIDVVGMAEDGNQAVSFVVTNDPPPHVVLMDMNMPHMDGITACGVIRTAAPATQVIMISVQDDAAPMREAIAQGAAAFLIKPVIPDDLIDLIRRAHKAYLSIEAAAGQP